MEHVENKASKNIIEDNIEKLRALFPEAFTESSDEGEPRWKVDFETLKQILGDYTEDRQERYSFSWNGKSRARLIAQTPSTGTLRPCPEESVDWDTTKNLFIEGDNLEVLKLLQKSYHKKVKMIYIDPPYNTGNEFIYPDKFQDNLDTYLRYTGQVDDEGFKVSTNSETGGRYHTNWLNMMYPRLKLARNLLRDDGVIFISIDDNEVANLRKICDEIFGEENFVGTFAWRSRTAKADVPFGVSSDVEWIITYSKSNNFYAGRTGNRKYFKTDDYKERWRTQDLTTNKTREQRPNSFFTMVNPRNGEKFPASSTRTWAVTKDTFSDYYEKGKIVFPGDYDFLRIKNPTFRVFESEDIEKAIKKYGRSDIKMSVSTYLPEKEVNRTEHGSKEIRNLFDSQVFNYPKPMNLIKYFVDISTDDDDIIMDFFAGSGTTAHSILTQNIVDEGKRKYILVQLPEQLDINNSEQKTAANYCTKLQVPLLLTELTKERIRRTGKKIREENPDYEGDLGFKVFKLDSSNIKPWDAAFDNYEEALINSVENIKTERTEQDVLYELLLKYGLDLTIPIETRSMQGKNVYIIGAGALVVCLDDEITLDAVEGIAKLKEELKPEVMRVVFKDAGFKDATVKTNTVQILKIAGIEDVKSL